MLDRPEFQSRRPGFRLCDLRSRVLILVRVGCFSPVDRDLGFATSDASLCRSCSRGFSPVDRDLGFATLIDSKEILTRYTVSVP